MNPEAPRPELPATTTGRRPPPYSTEPQPQPEEPPVGHRVTTIHPETTPRTPRPPDHSQAPAATEPSGPTTPLRFGYGTNGLADLRLDDALGLLADLGYDGVGLTLDHMHLDPLAPTSPPAPGRSPAV